MSGCPMTDSSVITVEWMGRQIGVLGHPPDITGRHQHAALEHHALRMAGHRQSA
jgi:hypothetical protein